MELNHCGRTRHKDKEVFICKPKIEAADFSIYAKAYCSSCARDFYVYTHIATPNNAPVQTWPVTHVRKGQVNEWLNYVEKNCLRKTKSTKQSLYVGDYTRLIHYDPALIHALILRRLKDEVFRCKAS